VDETTGIPVSGTGGITGMNLSGSYLLSANENAKLELTGNVISNNKSNTYFILNYGATALSTVLFTRNYVTDNDIQGPFIDSYNADLIIDSSVFQKFSAGSGAVIRELYSGNFLQISNSKFLDNQNRIISWEPYKSQNLTILGSEFRGNTGKVLYGAADFGGNHLIENSVFDGNASSSYGGAVEVFNGYYYYKNPSVLTVKDSVFTGNTAKSDSGESGGAIAFIQKAGFDANAVLNIISENANTTFSGNKTLASDGSFTSDAILVQNTDINLNAAEGKAVVFDDAVNGYNYAVNINKPGLTYTYEYWENDVKTEVTKDIPYAGEVRFNNAVNDADIHAYGGTITLLAAADSAPSAVYENTRLKTSRLTVEGDTVLNLQNETPVTEAAFSSMQEAEILALTMGAHLQKVYLGSELTLNGNLFVQPAVNLETATSDTFTVGGGPVTSTGGKILVNGWIVTADKASNTVVNVNLAADGDEELKSHFGLASGGEKAYGPVYVWDVKYAGDGTYEFVRREPEPYVYDNETTTPRSVDPVPVLTEDKPTDYNPDVYAGQVVSLGLSVVQHAISDTVFSETGVGSLGFLTQDEKPERKEWWGKVLGADLDLDTKNFHKIDMDYAIGMVGHQFDPIKTGLGDIEFGAYLGAASARARYSISKIRQNGAFAGGSVLYKNGHAWAGAHANVGVMSNHLKGLTDNRATTPWLGVGASLGYSFEFQAAKLAVTPMVDVSYVQVKSKDFTTDLGADVKNSRTHSFEVSPGLRIDKQFNNGWTAGFNARYAFVTKHDGKTTAQYAGDELHALPSISNKNYAEYGLSVKKQSKNLGFGLMLNRNDGGRRGWSGMARVSYSF
jgi:outer membrane autotransporter protein